MLAARRIFRNRIVTPFRNDFRYDGAMDTIQATSLANLSTGYARCIWLHMLGPDKAQVLDPESEPIDRERAAHMARTLARYAEQLADFLEAQP